MHDSMIFIDHSPLKKKHQEIANKGRMNRRCLNFCSPQLPSKSAHAVLIQRPPKMPSLSFSTHQCLLQCGPPPSDVCWLINSMNTIVIGFINHSY